MTVGVFRYAARTAEGELIRGSMEAPTREAVLASLGTRALFVTALEREHAVERAVRRSLHIGVPGRRALLAFFRSFATLVRSGIPLRRALEVCIARCNDAGLREALRAVLADVERGDAIGDALARRPRVFGRLQVAMIRAGEAGGILDDVLERLAGLLERDADVRKKLRAALAYPCAVLAAATLLVVFLLARIVPMFAQMFAAFHVEMPLTTRLLLEFGTLLAQPGLWLALGVVAALSTARWLWTMCAWPCRSLGRCCGVRSRPASRERWRPCCGRGWIWSWRSGPFVPSPGAPPTRGRSRVSTSRCARAIRCRHRFSARGCSIRSPLRWSASAKRRDCLTRCCCASRATSRATLRLP
jgi:type II secretory pathway component PulF